MKKDNHAGNFHQYKNKKKISIKQLELIANHKLI